MELFCTVRMHLQQLLEAVDLVALLLPDGQLLAERVHEVEVEFGEQNVLGVVGTVQHVSTVVHQQRVAVADKLLGELVVAHGRRSDNEHLVVDGAGTDQLLPLAELEEGRERGGVDDHVNAILAVQLSELGELQVVADAQTDLDVFDLEVGQLVAGLDVVQLVVLEVLAELNFEQMDLAVLSDQSAGVVEHHGGVVEEVGHLGVSLWDRTGDQVDLELLGNFGQEVVGLTVRDDFGVLLVVLLAIQSVEVLWQHHQMGLVALDGIADHLGGCLQVLQLVGDHRHLDGGDAELYEKANNVNAFTTLMISLMK